MSEAIMRGDLSDPRFRRVHAIEDAAVADLLTDLIRVIEDARADIIELAATSTVGGEAATYSGIRSMCRSLMCGSALHAVTTAKTARDKYAKRRAGWLAAHEDTPIFQVVES